MAKRKHTGEQRLGAHSRSIPIKSFILNTKDARNETALYANHAQFSVTANEIIIDLYVLGPVPNSPEKPEATLVQRVILPHTLAKGFATGLANLVDTYERDTGNILPLNRTPEPDERIKIWEHKSDDGDSEQLDSV